jgi:hypothetical protein
MKIRFFTPKDSFMNFYGSFTKEITKEKLPMLIQNSTWAMRQ